jgi:general secretion pathway protein G
MYRRKSYPGNLQRSRGFTFLEILVVVAILLLIATIAVISYGGHLKDAKIKKATLDISEISKALYIYQMDNGFYPTTEQGLKALVEKPDSEPEPKHWKEYIQDVIPKDPWGNDYVYVQPGTHKDFDIYSWGPDGVEGNEDDITSWVKKEEEKK